MRTLTRIIAPALAVALGMGAALPASAHETGHETRHEQPGRYTPVRNDAVRTDIHGLRTRIDRAAARHTISQREANGLRRDAGQIQRLYASYARDGLSRRETQILQARVDKVHFALRMERADRDGRRG